MIGKNRPNALLVFFIAIISVQAYAADADLSRIREEGLQRSQVMQVAAEITDTYGPRLTNSPHIKKASEWVTQTLKSWRISTVRLETWGPFGCGWSNERCCAHMTLPTSAPLIACPRAWTPGTSGEVTGDAIWIARTTSLSELELYRGQLAGKYVLSQVPKALLPHFTPDARRYTDLELEGFDSDTGQASRAVDEHAQKMAEFFTTENVAGIIDYSGGDDGTIFVTSGGSRDPRNRALTPRIVLAAEHYGRIYRLLQKKVPVQLKFDIVNEFFDADLNSFNIVAEIPGTTKADEIVMLGAHFDSWHAATGATDNAAGSAVMMEAMRILRTTGVTLPRTIRLALWTGEEQGLLGSRAYVKKHFTELNTKLSAYYNIDNGAGKIRGIYAQGNQKAGEIFSSWVKSFRDVGMTKVTQSNTGYTDHISFDEAGIPGFQFIQDPLDYMTRTHHTNMDTFERLQEDDLKQMAVIVASFVYLTAQSDALMPKK